MWGLVSGGTPRAHVFLGCPEGGVPRPGATLAITPHLSSELVLSDKGSMFPIWVPSERNFSWKKDYVYTLQSIMLLSVFQSSYYFIYM